MGVCYLNVCLCKMLPLISRLYSAVSLVSVVFVYFLIPETKGKSLEEIENHFSGKVQQDLTAVVPLGAN